jgi:hypothetical protein
MGWPFESKKAALAEVRRITVLMGDKVPRGMSSRKLRAINEWIQVYYNQRGCHAAEIELKTAKVRRDVADSVAGHVWKQDVRSVDYADESMENARAWEVRFVDVNDAIVGSSIGDIVRRNLGHNVDTSLMNRRVAVAILGLTPRRRYKELCLTHHPDKGGDPDIFRAIAEAYSMIA